MEIVLVQETDAATLEVITIALQMEGYKVFGSADANENILEMIRRHHPKLVLLDCWLNQYSGQRICQWIKAHFPKLPVVALSCQNLSGAQYREAGFSGHIPKPFDLKLLYRVVKKYIRPRMRTNELAASTC